MRRLGPQTATKHKNKTNSEKKQEWCFPGINKKRFIFPLDFFSKKKKQKQKTKQNKKNSNNKNTPKLELKHLKKDGKLQVILFEHVLLLSIGREG